MMDNFKFGTVGSPKSTPAKPGGSIGGIQRLYELGLNALELGWVQSVRVSEKSCLEIHDKSMQFNVAVSVHAPYFINLNADELEWPKSKKRLLDAAFYGYLAGASDIVFHPGSYANYPAKALKTAIVRLKEVAKVNKKNNTHIKLRPETMGKSALLGSINDVLEMSKAIEEVEPCLDFAHLFARHGTGEINDFQHWFAILSEYKDALGADSLNRLHIHLSGIEFSTKGERKHLPIRESPLNVKAIFKALKELNCQGRILCESPLLEDDALVLKKMWIDQ